MIGRVAKKSGYCNDSARKANLGKLARAVDCVYFKHCLSRSFLSKPDIQPAAGCRRELYLMDHKPDEQRRFVRSPSSALVEMQHPTLGLIEVKARDLSDGGISVLMGNIPAPPLGLVMQVRIKRYTGIINKEPVPMRVVHHQFGCVGLAFVR
jgi:hypothetical protein